MKKLILFASIILTSNLLSGQIINIPDDYPTIQQGINAANTGDTVLVDQGSYLENIDYDGKNITVASQYLLSTDPSDIEQTIINGNQNGCVVTFENEEDSTALLIGFTITNGLGGIHVNTASPMIAHLKIKYNETSGYGGGLYFENSNSKLSNLTITNNESNGLSNYIFGGGGGIYSLSSNLVMDSLIVSYNSASSGGGIAIEAGSQNWISNSRISENIVYQSYSGMGGGLKVMNSHVDLENVMIKDNYVYSSCAPSSYGGGVFLGSSTMFLSNVTVKNNEADEIAGGIYLNQSFVTFDTINKSSIFNNKAPVGHDISGWDFDSIIEVVLDTFSVVYPTDYYVEPCKYFNFNIANGLVQQVDADLFISPDGNNNNSGLTADDPLRNIQYALSILQVDSLHPHTIYLMDGTYSPMDGQEYFPINIPDYCHLVGSSAENVILNAEATSNVINIGHNTETLITGITITGGLGKYDGGGIFCSNSNPLLSNLVVSNNECSPPDFGYGGGLYLRESNPLIKNMLLLNNQADHGGGAILYDSNPIFTNVCISGNSNGGIKINDNSNPVLINAIMWNDSLYEIGFDGDPATSATVSISWSDIQGGEEGILTSQNDTVYWLDGNINTDPLFLDSGSHPYQLTVGSPCIDTGTPDTTGLNLPTKDIIGNIRIWDGDNNGTAIIDMGAYEYGSVPVNIKEPISTNPLTKTKLKIFPNPFYQSTTIELVIKEKSKVTLLIYNQLGEKVKTLFEGKKEIGIHQLTWDSENLSSEIYFIKLETENQISTQKIIKK